MGDRNRSFEYSELRGVWPKVNLRMDGTARGSQRLKYDWVVKPGGDLNDIVVRHEGTVVEAKDDGSLVHYMGETGEIVEGTPFAFQLIGTRFVEVECEYKVKHKKDGATEVRFKVGDYDEDYDLVIDPDIVFATYIGATQANWGFTAGSDDDGNSIGGAALWEGDMGTYPTTAGAISTDFTLADGPFDLGITVFTPDGTGIIYSTIAGGNGWTFLHQLWLILMEIFTCLALLDRRTFRQRQELTAQYLTADLLLI